jgi:pimeloyl-ACP methyl ester carboxylesterase
VSGLAARIRERPLPALRGWFAGMFAEGEIEEPPLVAMAQHLLDGAPPDPEGAARSLEGLAAADLRSAVPSITVPTLFLHGERDPVAPAAAARWLAGCIPGARLIVMPEAGHAPQLSRPREAVDAVRTLLAELE